MTEAPAQPPTIPGYQLTKRLGAGGYGEVWLAHAPGGLTKAIKIIYGAFDDRRAEVELRSLHRIKSVRHPFLLSLERIEVVENRLAIVTELADSSLKDRYDECRRQGLPGIPRAELLGFLRDAADALDFLGERHSLQHLDVKPENLLVVGGHIKVADFGLVKEVGRTQASLVGGLTPLYSSPEVFQGTAGVRSDQYSLAVVYQEMLTGAPPFPGQSAAELTLQHLQSDPDVAPLPPHDRFVIARALSKDPAQRFANCTEMVEALLAGNDAADFSARVDASSDLSSGVDPHAPVDWGIAASAAEEAHHWTASAPAEATTPIAPVEPEAAPTPPVRRSISLPAGPARSAANPTAIIGVGGLAGRMLRQLRSRLNRELGDQGCDRFEMLLIDTDPQGIAAAVEGAGRLALRPDQTLLTPLRKPQEYRQDSAQLMRWLARRWLFNIPKSLRTEGMRPLGRLALVDHFRPISAVIQNALQRAAQRSPSPTPADRANDGEQRRLRVYVVAGVSGGTGSGMSLDLGYALKQITASAGADDCEVIGLFLHAAPRDARQSDLAKVNSFAWLREFNHFQHVRGGYSGDEGCGLAPAAAGEKAFDAAYFLDFGTAQDADALDKIAADVAEYLFLDGTTPAHQFFAACRAKSTTGEAASLRSFRIKRSSAADDDAIHAGADAISRAVLISYLGHRDGPAPVTTEHAGFDLAEIASRLSPAIEATVGRQLAAIGAESLQLGDYVRAIDSCFATSDDGLEHFIVGDRLDHLTVEVAAALATEASAAILGLVDVPGARLAGAMAALGALRTNVQQLDAASADLATALARQAAAAKLQIERWQHDRLAAKAAEREQELAAAYLHLQLERHAYLGARLAARRVIAELRSIDDRLSEMTRQLKGMVEGFPPAADVREGDPFAQAIAEQLAALASEVDAELEVNFLNLAGGLLAVATGGLRVRDRFLTDLEQATTRCAERVAASPSLVQRVALAHRPNPVAGVVDGVELPAACCGGAFAEIECVPGGSSEATWESDSQGVATLRGAESAAVWCCEAWDLPASRVAQRLVEGRTDLIDCAERVACRCDVEWTPISAPTAPPAIVTALPFQNVSSTQTQSL